MNIKEKLASLLAEGEALRKKAVDSPESFTEEDANRADEVVAEHDRLKSILDRQSNAVSKMAGLEVKEPDLDEDGEELTGSLGARFAKSEAYRNFHKALSPSGEISEGTPINVRAVVGKADVLHTGATNLQPSPQFTDDMVFRAPRTLLSLITRGETSASYLPYRQVVSKTNNAAVVAESTATDGAGAEGGLKPISTLGTQPAEAKAYTYADGIEVTTQELKDDGAIAAIIDSMLTENIEMRIEDMLLNGSGEGILPKGLLNTTGVNQVAFATDAVTSTRKGLTALQKLGVQPTALLLNPEDEEAWDLLTDQSGRFLGAGPFATGPAMAWGMPRVSSIAVPKGTAIMGDFRTMHLLDRDPLQIVAFNQHKDYAQRNLVYIRAERRAMQLIRKPAAFAVIELTAGA